jgi:hypothetical protein
VEARKQISLKSPGCARDCISSGLSKDPRAPHLFNTFSHIGYSLTSLRFVDKTTVLVPSWREEGSLLCPYLVPLQCQHLFQSSAGGWLQGSRKQEDRATRRFAAHVRAVPRLDLLTRVQGPERRTFQSQRHCDTVDKASDGPLHFRRQSWKSESQTRTAQ